jgi:glycosyltransferase involved in cell wall biosynthesis
MESQPLVSIVIPIYNEAEHLAESLESVLAQTYQNWDCTIVDNFSTDSSGEIAARYESRDSRIRVSRPAKFLQALENHNAAIRQISSKSKYCKVLFGDDWLFPECLELMVAVAEKHPSVGVVGAYTLEGDRVTLAGLPYQATVINGREVCRRHFLDRLYVFGSANSVLYRSELVRSQDPFYNEANFHADTEVCFALLRNSDFGFVHQVLTFTRVRSACLTAMSTDMCTNYAGMLRILKTHGPYYLNPKEFRICLNEHMAAYYRVLAKCLLRGRNKAFWDWHRTELLHVGLRFRALYLARGVLSVLCEALLNPKSTVAKAVRLVPRAQSRKRLPIPTMPAVDNKTTQSRA